MNGFNEDQILEIRRGSASFDPKLDALVKFAKTITLQRGKADQEAKDAFFAAGYTEASMIDLVIVIGDKIISNYIHNLTQFAIDFPVAVPLDVENA